MAWPCSESRGDWEYIAGLEACTVFAQSVFARVDSRAEHADGTITSNQGSGANPREDVYRQDSQSTTIPFR